MDIPLCMSVHSVYDRSLHTDVTFLLYIWNQDGDTPLHIASSNGFAAMVRYLISKKADIGTKNKV